MLPRHARCVLSRLRCIGHSLLLGSYLSRIGRIENPSCSACGHSSQNTSHFILHCPATDSFRRSTLWRPSVSLRPLASCPASGAPWSSAMPPYLGRGRVIDNNNKNLKEATFVILKNHTSAPVRKERFSPTSKARREASRNKIIEKSGMPDIKSVREVDRSKSGPTAQMRLVKPIQNGLRK